MKRSFGSHLISKSSILALAIGGAWGAPALAQDQAAESGGLRDIVVTARRVEERLQDVPLSITAFDAQSLQDNQISQVQDLGSQVPNLVTGKTSVAGAGQIAIRGVQGQSLPRPGLDTRVGVYLDGVYLARSMGQSFSLADIERIEVLKGPQGTLFGRNVTAGSVNIITAAPKGEFGGVLEGGLGSRDRKRFRATLELPEAGGFSARVTYMHDEQDGDIKNLSAGFRANPVVINVPAQAAQPATATSEATPASPARTFTFTPKPAAKTLNAGNYESLFVALRYEGIDGLVADYKFDWSDQRETFPSVYNNGFVPGGGCVFAAIALGASLNQCTATGLPGSAFPTLPAFANGIISTPGVVSNVGGGTGGYFISNGAQGFTVGNRRPDATYDDWTSGSSVKTYGHNLTLNYEVSDTINARSITAYRRLTTEYAANLDSGSYTLNNDFLRAVNPGLYANASYPAGGISPFPMGLGYTAMKQSQVSQEFQLFGQATEWLDFLGGLYYFREQASYFQVSVANNATTPAALLTNLNGITNIPPYSPTGINNWGVGAVIGGDDSNVTSKSYALFGRLTFKPIEGIEIVIGGRYTIDKKSSTVQQFMLNALDDDLVTAGRQQPDNPWRRTFKKFTYDGTITYHVTPDINVYARYATAYLAGGQIRNVPFNPETTKAAEVGFKSELFDRRVRFNAAAFYQKSKNTQFNRPSSIAVVLPAPVGPTTVFATQLFNLGTGRVKGFEAELTVVPFTGLTASGSVGYTNQKYVTPLIPVFTRPPAAEWTIQGSLQYDTPPVLGDAYLSFRVDGNYRSRYSPTVTGPLLAAGTTPGALPTELLALYGLPNTVAGRTAYTNLIDRQGEVGGYWIANARVSVVDIPMFGAKGRLSAFVKNLFDEDQGKVYTANYGNEIGGAFVEKRAYGMDLTINF